jgi:hypothetical protein
MRLGAFLTEALGQALDEADNERIWALARERLVIAEAELEKADSDDAKASLEGQIEVCKLILGIDDENTGDGAEDASKEDDLGDPLEGVMAHLLPVVDQLCDLVVRYREDKMPSIGWAMIERVTNNWSAYLERMEKERQELRREQRKPGYHRRDLGG